VSRGLGNLQRRIIDEMNSAIDQGAVSVRLRDLYARWPMHNRRSLERALKTLVDRGVITIVSGAGRPEDVYRYAPADAPYDLSKIFVGLWKG
jgi:hypothetical protein